MLGNTNIVQAVPTPLHAFDTESQPNGIPGDKLIDNQDVKTTTVFRPLTGTVVGPNGVAGQGNYFPNGVQNSVTPINNALSGNPINYGGGYVSLWSSSATAGVLWSNDAYKMDLDKDQYFSFWLWGSDSDILTQRTTGGMAFAIQNDSRQQNAFSYDNNQGQSLQIVIFNLHLIRL